MRNVSAIGNSPLFDGVDHRTVSMILDSLVEESWGKGRLIAGPTDSGESFRLVIEGRAKVVRTNAQDGRELSLWLLGPGDGFDIVSLLDGKPHAITVWAVDEVRTLAAPMPVWRKWLEDSQPLRLAAHRYVADKLRELTELAGELALHDTSSRLAHLLLRHFEGSGNNLLRDLPQRELACMIGSVRVVVSRLLAQMRREGVVELHGGAVHAVDLKRLLARAEAALARERPVEAPNLKKY